MRKASARPPSRSNLRWRGPRSIASSGKAKDSAVFGWHDLMRGGRRAAFSSRRHGDDAARHSHRHHAAACALHSRPAARNARMLTPSLREGRRAGPACPPCGAGRTIMDLLSHPSQNPPYSQAHAENKKKILYPSLKASLHQPHHRKEMNNGISTSARTRSPRAMHQPNSRGAQASTTCAQFRRNTRRRKAAEKHCVEKASRTPRTRGCLRAGRQDRLCRKSKIADRVF